MNDHIYFYWTNKDNVQVVSDFFTGSFEDFEVDCREHANRYRKDVRKAALDGYKIISYAEDYLKEVEKVKMLISL